MAEEINPISPYPDSINIGESPVLRGLAQFTNAASEYLGSRALQQQQARDENLLATAQLEIIRNGGKIPEDILQQSYAYQNALKQAYGEYLGTTSYQKLLEEAQLRPNNFPDEQSLYNRFFEIDSQNNELVKNDFRSNNAYSTSAVKSLDTLLKLVRTNNLARTKQQAQDIESDKLVNTYLNKPSSTQPKNATVIPTEDLNRIVNESSSPTPPTIDLSSSQIAQPAVESRLSPVATMQGIQLYPTPAKAKEVLSIMPEQQLTDRRGFIVHHTGGHGNVDGVIETFKQRKVATHFVIDRDGKIHQILPLDRVGQHIKSPDRPQRKDYRRDLSNSNTYGVEIIANDDADVTDAQVEAAVDLATRLGYGAGDIFAHSELQSDKQQTTKERSGEGMKVVQRIRGGQKALFNPSTETTTTTTVPQQRTLDSESAITKERADFLRKHNISLEDYLMVVDYYKGTVTEDFIRKSPTNIKTTAETLKKKGVAK